MSLYNRMGRPPVDSRAKTAWANLRQSSQVAALARHLGVTTAAVSKWTHVPADRLNAVAQYLNLHPDVLRPDLAPAPWDDLITSDKQT